MAEVRAPRNFQLKLLIDVGFVTGWRRSKGMIEHHPELKEIIGICNLGRGRNHHEVYSAFDLFGISGRNLFYYDVRRKNLLTTHLTRLFEIRNPNPSASMKSKFTRILHENNLEAIASAEKEKGEGAMTK